MQRDKLAAELERDEDNKASAYRDSLGYLTIGIGHCIDSRVGGQLSERLRRIILEDDIEGVEEQLDRALPWWRELSECRQRVLANMCFNLGVAKLIKFQATLAAIKAGDYPTAAKQMLKSLWAQQVGERAKRLAYMMEHDSEEN